MLCHIFELNFYFWENCIYHIWAYLNLDNNKRNKGLCIQTYLIAIVDISF